MDACKRAGVELGKCDAWILTWLANREPETCAVVAGLITRANASAYTAAVVALQPDPE